MSNRPPRSNVLVKRLLCDDESAFVCFYISAHYNALRLSSAPLPGRTDDEAYLERVRSMLSDLQIDDHYTTVSHLAWKCAKLMSRHIKVDLWEEPKTGAASRRRLEKDAGKGKFHLVTGKKFVLSLDDERSRVFNLVPKGNVPFEPIATTYRAKPTNRALSCQVWGDITDNDSSHATKQVEPVVTYQIDFGDSLDHRVDLPNEVHPHNGRYIKLRNQISFRAQMKIDCTLQVAPQFWVIKIPCLLLKRRNSGTEPCCDPHGQKLTGSSCVRSSSIESHWKQVLGPIFTDSAGQWTEVPKLIQSVMASLSRLSLLLPPGELQKELSTILVSYVQATMKGEDLSSEERNDYCLDQPQMVELITRNLLAYDPYLDVPDKITILEWICGRMKLVNLGSVYFTASLLQYLHYLVHGIDSHSRLTNNDVDLLCKVAKVAHWINKMLDDEDQKNLKQLVVDEQEVEEEWTDEEEEQEEEEEEMSDSDESNSEMSESSQETQTEPQEETINPNVNEPNQSMGQTKHENVRSLSPIAHLRAMARKLNRKCGQLLDELNDNDDH